MRRVAVLGPGRVGTTLALALARVGDQIVGVAGRSSHGVAAFRERFPGAAEGSPAEVTRRAELVLVTVHDDAVEEVVRAAAREDGVTEGSRWVHCAGGLDLAPLAAARAAGARVAALHPAQTFADPDSALHDLPGTAWAVTADEPDLGWARVLVTDLRGTPVTVAAEQRRLYHAGLVVGANGASSVVALARDLLHGAGLTDPGAFLDPLVRPAAANAAADGVRALTGPVRRGDAATVEAHLGELGAVFPEAVEAYVALARLALGQSRRAGLGEERAAAVADLLDQVGAEQPEEPSHPPVAP